MTIRHFREIHGLTQTDFCQAVTLPNGKHLHQPSLSRYENGIKVPSRLDAGVAVAMVAASKRIAAKALGREPGPGECLEVEDLVNLHPARRGTL